MKRNDLVKLSRHLEDQGGQVRATKAGFLALNPVTRKTVSWHRETPSDHRGTQNLKRDVVSAGFTWPAALSR